MRIQHLLGLANTPTRTPCPPGNVCRDLRKYLQIRLTDVAPRPQGMEGLEPCGRPDIPLSLPFEREGLRLE